MKALSLLVVLAAAALAITQTKPTLKPEDYKQWESISVSRLSADGKWLAWGINLIDGDGRLVYRNVDGPETATIPVGQNPTFSDDSKWLAYLIGLPKAEVDKRVAEKKRVELRLGLRELATNKEHVFDEVQSYRFVKGNRYLLAHRYHGIDKPSGGSDLTVIDLSDLSTTTLGNVTGFVLNDAEDLLALYVQSDSKNEGVQLLDLRSSNLKTIVWGKEHVRNLTWAEEADKLAFLLGKENEKKDGDWHSIVVVDGLRSKPVKKTFDPAALASFPKDHRITEFVGLDMDPMGEIFSFGIRKWEDKKRPKKPEDIADVDVWNTKDVVIQPQQRLRAPFESRQSFACIWKAATDTFMQIGNDDLASVQITKNHDYALLIDQKRYESGVTDGVTLRDGWAMNLTTGTKTRITEKQPYSPAISPDGKFCACYEGKDWWIYDFASGTRKNITKGANAKFEDVDYDGTLPYAPPESFPTWLSHDAGAILYDKYDAFVWRAGTDRVYRLTDGYKEKLRLRLTDIETWDDVPGIDIGKPMYFRIQDTVNKGSGYMLLPPGGEGKPLAFFEKNITALSKAKDADRMMFVMGTFEESPNIYITNSLMSQAKPVTNTNPQQAKYAWSKTELIHFKNKRGQDLQGTLIYPADYQAGRKYPMITYIYERLSDNFYAYQPPVEWSAYNSQVFAQNGYFVFLPDITYERRQPGKSAVDCLEPAVDAVLKKGLVDPAKVGLVGHSWGGYQTAYVITQSKKFSAAVAGAPLINLISFYGTVYWNSGTPIAQLLETGQGRLEVPYWEDMRAYTENSPLFNAHKIKAPLMVAFGDKDGAVDWHQGQEMYATMRRLGKPMVLLVYQNENHGLAKRANQLDYARRVRHFFDVHLKGAKAEPWITEGAPFLKKDG